MDSLVVVVIRTGILSKEALSALREVASQRMVGSMLFRMLEKDKHGTCCVFSDRIAYCCVKGHFAIVHTSLFLHVGRTVPGCPVHLALTY